MLRTRTDHFTLDKFVISCILSMCECTCMYNIWFKLISTDILYMLKENEDVMWHYSSHVWHVLRILSCQSRFYIWKQYFLSMMTVFVMPLSFWLLLLMCTVEGHHHEQASISIVQCWVAALPISQSKDWKTNKTVGLSDMILIFYMWASEKGQQLQWSVVLYLLYKIYLAIRIN